MEIEDIRIPVEGDLVQVKGKHIGEVTEIVGRGVGQGALFKVDGTDPGWYELAQIEFVERADQAAIKETYNLDPIGDTLKPRYYIVARHVSGEFFITEVTRLEEQKAKIKWLAKQPEFTNVYKTSVGERQR